jgi:hypothetical protein
MVIAAAGPGSFGDWLADRANRRQVPYRFKQCEYSPVRNPTNKRDGLWKKRGKQQAVYGQINLNERDRIAAAEKL